MSPNDIVKFVGPGTSTDDACNTFNSNITNLGLNGNRVESGSFLGRLSQVDGKIEDVSVRSVIFYKNQIYTPLSYAINLEMNRSKLYQQHTVYVKLCGRDGNEYWKRKCCN